MTGRSVLGRYDALHADEIAQTAELLHRRIDARFPTRHLTAIAGEVVEAVRRAGADESRLQRPTVWLRWSCGLLVLLFLAALGIGIGSARHDAANAAGELSVFDWLSIFDTAVNDLVFGAIAIFFLFSIEPRHKRSEALTALHKLRAMGHAIDMHQLAKDPERLISRIGPTAITVPLDLTPEELGRYLDYCSELLSIVGKAAAIYAQASSDAQVLSAVNEIENLTSGLSRKIWQKITLLHSVQL